MRRLRLALATVVAATALTALAGPAGAAGVISDSEAYSIIAAANSSGIISSVDRARLLTRPDIAGSFVDPTKAPDQLNNPVASGQSVGGVKVYNADRYLVYKSYTGGKVVDYHFTVTWNGDGTILGKTVKRDHYLKAYTASIYDRGFTTNSVAFGTGAKSATVRLQAEWEQCILKFGCIAQDNPLAIFTLRPNGSYDYKPTL